MKKSADEELDDLFRKGMEDPVNESAYREGDWDDLEQKLDKSKKRPGIVYRLSFIGSAAALFLLFLGWLFFRPEIIKNQHQQASIVRHSSPNASASDSKKENTGISGGPIRLPTDSPIQKILGPVNYAKNTGPGHRQISKPFLPLSADGARRDTTGYNSKDVNSRPEALSLFASDAGVPTMQDAVGDRMVSADNVLVKYVGAMDKATDATDNGVKINSIIKPKSGKGPQLALGVIASSDLNGVNSSFVQSKIGGNFGAVISVGLSKKWTVSTGATYDIKPYLTDFNNYHTRFQFKTTPSSVDANCRMLEIPVNINYQVYSKQANKITLGTGLSSYFMLREDYTFNYTNPYANVPSNYSVINKNRNILSIVNLDATYEHQINSKVGVVIQPYLKVPLSNVGASQVRLQTTGVAVGLNWNLNSMSKR